LLERVRRVDHGALVEDEGVTTACVVVLDQPQGGEDGWIGVGHRVRVASSGSYGHADERARRYFAGMATHWTLGCDAADPHGIAAFWAIALGYVAEPGYDDPDGASIIDPDGVGPAIGFLRVPEGKTAKNRMHIDIRVAGEPPWDMAGREQLIRAKAAELVTAGATTVREESYGDHLGHVVMLDPEGNEFCVA
jgi:Glyoxalase-like domain